MDEATPEQIAEDGCRSLPRNWRLLRMGGRECVVRETVRQAQGVQEILTRSEAVASRRFVRSTDKAFIVKRLQLDSVSLRTVPHLRL